MVPLLRYVNVCLPMMRLGCLLSALPCLFSLTSQDQIKNALHAAIWIVLSSSSSCVPGGAGLAEVRQCSLYEMLTELRSLLEYIGLRHKTKQSLIGG